MADGPRKRKMDNVESDGDLNIFEWNIASFTEAFKKTTNGEKWTSPIFVGKSTGQPNSFWYISLFPKGIENNAEGNHLAVYLIMSKKLNQSNRVINAKYKVCLLNRNQQLCRFTDRIEELGGNYRSWGFPVLATHSEVFDNKNGFLDDDILRIQIKLWILNGETNGVAPKRQFGDQLHKDFSQLLESSEFSDVIIVAEGCILEAHKNVLSCRSPVFAAMIKNNLSQFPTSVVIVEDFSATTVKGMLEFIYSGNTESVDQDFKELLKIAEKYHLGDLKEVSVKTAILKMTVENVVELLILADKYNAPELKLRAMAFINSNKANPMFSPGNENGVFEKLAEERPKLLLEMYKNLRNNDVRVHHSEESTEILEEVIRFTRNVKH